MAKINSHYSKLKSSYLFQEIQKRISLYSGKTPLLNLGIGDVSLPLAPSIVHAIVEATKDLGHFETHVGYGPSQGYAFLREKIAHFDFGGSISPDEIFISNSAKCDVSNIQELFSTDNKVALSDPTYPVYVDSNVLAGRSGACKEDGTYEGIHYLKCVEETHFLPPLPYEQCALIYLCSPNNPTGASLPKRELEKWVEYALQNNAILLFDSAYEAFITSDAPHSIYTIEDAKKCAIEFRSFSKKGSSLSFLFLFLNVASLYCTLFS